MTTRYAPPLAPEFMVKKVGEMDLRFEEEIYNQLKLKGKVRFTPSRDKRVARDERH